MIAVGLWGAQLGAPALWSLPVAFPMVMALGGQLLTVTALFVAATGVFLRLGRALSGVARERDSACDSRGPAPR